MAIYNDIHTYTNNTNVIFTVCTYFRKYQKIYATFTLKQTKIDFLNK